MEKMLRFWGKTGQDNNDANRFHPVLFHMIDVAAVARVLLSEQASSRWRKTLGNVLHTDSDMLLNWLPWLIALHDIGKISVPFQEQNEAQRTRLINEGFKIGNKRWNNNPPHGIISQVFIRYENEYPLKEKLRIELIDLAGGHHGWFTDIQKQKEAQQMLRKEPTEWKAYRREASQILFNVLKPEVPDNLADCNVSAASMILTGFCILCDWLGSDNTVFLISPGMTVDTYAIESLNRAYMVIKKAGFFSQTKSKVGYSFQELFKKVKARPLQCAIDEIPASLLSYPSLTVIEAPTGEGKTEAALALVHRIAQFSNTDEFYYALPTTATSNQMFGRLQKYLQDNLGLSTQVNLIHGQAYLYQDSLILPQLKNGSEDEEDTIAWFAPKKRALLAPFGVGTVDQTELAALKIKHIPLRMIGIAGKTLIIDEVHAYDVYMTTIIEMLLQWLGKVGTSVILLSATLPKERRALLAKAYCTNIPVKMEQSLSYPSLWVVNNKETHAASPAVQQPNRIIRLNTALNYRDDQIENKAKWLIDAVAEGGCACWMSNTVAQAQKIFALVDKTAPVHIECFLLHAQLPLDERQLREQEITNKFGPKLADRKPSIVIGTQVLEQSLDLDFDVMVSDIAPIDLLLQRAGRLHRHIDRKRPNKYKNPCFYINAERDTKGMLIPGVSEFVYDEYILRQTWRTLQNRELINLPGDYRPLIESVYSGEAPAYEDSLYDAWEKLQNKQSNAEQEARLRIIPEPSANDSFTSPISRLRFDEESETEAAGWIVAKTRLGEESITLIPVEYENDIYSVRINGKNTQFNLEQEFNHELQLNLLRRSIRVSNQRAIRALQSKAEDIPGVFKKANLLKDTFPLFLTDNKAMFSIDHGNLSFTLEPKLGLVIYFTKGG